MSKLKDFIQAQGEHHVMAAKCFKALAAHLVSSSPEAAGECAKLASEHALAAEDCVVCMKTMDTDDGLEKRLQPWPAPTMPMSDAPVRAVPRFGQPSVPDAINTTNVPEEFRKLLVPFDDEI